MANTVDPDEAADYGLLTWRYAVCNFNYFDFGIFCILTVNCFNYQKSGQNFRLQIFKKCKSKLYQRIQRQEDKQ